MATDRFNRQFILLDFADLDNPEFMSFVRSPEFSTYLVMRRYIWRSPQPHYLGLHEYYAQGLLACALSREKIAEAAGGVSSRQVTRDIAALVERGVVKSVGTGRGNVFILGKWGRDPEDNVYYEYFFLDRLHQPTDEEGPEEGAPDSGPAPSESYPQVRNTSTPRLDKNVQSERTSNVPNPPSGHFCPVGVDNLVHSGESFLSTINIELNKEKNREISNSKPPHPLDKSTSDSISDEEDEILESEALELLIETCSREFGDLEHIESNLTRAFNLWTRTRFDEEEIMLMTRKARDITKDRISRSAIKDRSKRMAYFFSVLERLLRLREPVTAKRCVPG